MHFQLLAVGKKEEEQSKKKKKERNKKENRKSFPKNVGYLMPVTFFTVHPFLLSLTIELLL